MSGFLVSEEIHLSIFLRLDVYFLFNFRITVKDGLADDCPYCSIVILCQFFIPKPAPTPKKIQSGFLNLLSVGSSISSR